MGLKTTASMVLVTIFKEDTYIKIKHRKLKKPYERTFQLHEGIKQSATYGKDPFSEKSNEF